MLVSEGGSMFNNKKIKEQQELIDCYREERDKYRNRYDNAIKSVSNLQDDLRESVKKNYVLMEENKKLIEWIKTIINEVGCYEVKDRNQFRIPIYKEESSRMIDGFGEQKRKDITIPTIHITELSKFDDWYV